MNEFEVGEKILLALLIWTLVGAIAALILGRCIRFGNPSNQHDRIEPTIARRPPAHIVRMPRRF